MRFNYKHITFLLLLTSSLLSCTGSLSSKDLRAFVSEPDNGLYHTKEINGITYQLKYKPSSFVALQGFKTKPFNEQEYQKELDNYSEYWYFTLKITTPSGDVLNNFRQNKSNYIELLNRLYFELANYVYAKPYKAKDVELEDFVAPRLYEHSTSTNILLVFKKSDLQNHKSFEIILKEYGLYSGDISFKFQTSDIKNTPQLKIENNENI